MNTQAILTTHPQAATLSHMQALTACVDACFECAQVCSSCADACLSEAGHLAHLVACIRLDLDCAGICAVTGRILLRISASPTALIRAQLEVCQTACRACAEECEAHAREMGMAHCRVCAESCRRCEAACQALLKALAASNLPRNPLERRLGAVASGSGGQAQGEGAALAGGTPHGEVAAHRPGEATRHG